MAPAGRKANNNYVSLNHETNESSVKNRAKLVETCTNNFGHLSLKDS